MDSHFCIAYMYDKFKLQRAGDKYERINSIGVSLSNVVGNCTV